MKPKNRAAGRWLIESMGQPDRDFMDEEVRGYFEFDAKESGDIKFGYVQGRIDCPSPWRWCDAPADTHVWVAFLRGRM